MNVWPRIKLALAGTLVAGVFATLCQVIACGSFFAAPTVDPTKIDSELAECRREARVEREAGAPPDLAYEAYVRCTKDAGLRK